MYRKLAGAIALLIWVTCLVQPVARSEELLVQGSGNVTQNTGLMFAMMGSTFSFEIRVDDTIPNSSGGGSTIATFNTCLYSFVVDGYQLLSSTGGRITFSRSPSADTLSVLSMTFLDREGIWTGPLPLSYFGNGPYTIDQLTPLDSGVFTELPVIQLFEDSTGYFAEGEITSLSVSTVPTATPSPLCVNHGDVNFDYAVTAGDAQLAFAIVLGQVAPTSEEECAADCNGDSLVTAGDAQQIFLTVLGSDQCVDTLQTPTPTPTIPYVVINEIRTDQSGSDYDEYFELYGDPDGNLIGLTYLVIGDGAGGSGIVEAVVDLSEQTIPSDGYFVGAEGTFTLGTADLITNINFENADNVTHLLVANFTGVTYDDLDTDDDGILDITPWSSIIDAIGLINDESTGELFYGAALGFVDIGPDTSGQPAHVIRCIDGGSWTMGSYELGVDDSPGDANICTTPTPSPTPVITPGDLISVDPIVGSMRYVPGGTFAQGSLFEEPCSYGDEDIFDHTLSQGFAMMETEITRQMWTDLLAVQSSLPVDPTDLAYGSAMMNPVQNLTWYEAVLFANVLSTQNGFTPCYYRNTGLTIVVDATNYINDDHICNFLADGYRLPTEGEWEFTARAGSTEPFLCHEPNYTSVTCDEPWCQPGEFPVLETCILFCANASGTSDVVGSNLSNTWNIADMSGNVWEWCWDWYGLYPIVPETDFTGEITGTTRVKRGGAWTEYASFCRNASRFDSVPDERNFATGFRLVRTMN